MFDEGRGNPWVRDHPDQGVEMPEVDGVGWKKRLELEQMFDEGRPP